jgi:hypothetical protein
LLGLFIEAKVRDRNRPQNHPRLNEDVRDRVRAGQYASLPEIAPGANASSGSIGCG